MPVPFKRFLQRWAISTVAVLVATLLLPGIDYGSSVDLLIATLVLGILNSFVRPVLMLLSLPLLILTLGLFSIVINALLLLLVSAMLGPTHFRVDGFLTALFGAVIISIVSLLLNSLTGSGGSRITVRRGRTPEEKPPRDKRDDDGPVIDV
jgi:putative membrane protein